MSTPALLLGAALLFWGWQTGLFLAAFAMACVLEGSRMTSRRWDFTKTDFIRMSDLCAVLFVASTAYLYSTLPPMPAIMTISRWLPLTVFFLMAAQVYSAQAGVDSAALALSWRARSQEGPRALVDISYPYLIVCVIAAAAANVRAGGFYAGMVALAAWGLWPAKPRRTPALLWGALLGLAAALGYAAQGGLHGLQNILEKEAVELFFGNGEVPTDPYRSRTAIGRIGELKQSGEILLRVKAGGGVRPLLREASYDTYHDAQWYAKRAPFSALRGGENEAWEIAPRQGSRWVSVSQYFRRGEGMLALPSGVTRVSGLYAGTLQRNRLGAVKIEAAARWATYTALSGDRPADGPPGPEDLELPAEEEAVFARLASELRLKGLRPADAAARVVAFFADGFSYSTYQAEVKTAARPLENFILNTKSGHCELFAASTVLLLREAGIPARYATGFSLQEYSRLEKAFLVRQRHAHAWTLAFLDGAWRDVDTTPPSWGEIEARRAGWSESIDDLLSLGRTRFALWRWRKKEASPAKTLRWLLIPLAAFAAWRFAPRARTAAPAAGKAPPVPAEARGKDSEWYAIERELARSGRGRLAGETQGDWLGRMGLDSLRPLLSLHYRHRFDPRGLEAAEREELRRAAESWLETARIAEP